MAMTKRRKARLAAVALLGLGLAVAAFALSMAHSRRPISRPSEAVPIAVSIRGKIARWLVRDGEHVRQGQPVAELDDSAYQAQLKQAEAQLQQLQTKAQAAIVPAPPTTIAGELPRTLPKLPPTPSVVRPVQTTQPVKSAPISKPSVPAKPAAIQPKPSAPSADGPRARQAAARDAVAKAAKALDAATTALAAAQTARDALRPKIARADVDADEAAKKADSAKQLLDAGVISANRSAQLLADRDATQKALADLQGQAKAADQTLTDAQANQKVASDAVAKAEADLQNADQLASKSSTEDPDAVSAPKTTAPRPPVAKQPMVVQSGKSLRPEPSHRAVTPPPAVVRVEKPRAIPLQVFVDQKTLSSSQEEIARLQALILDLKAKISACVIAAPVSGTVRISPSGTLSIVPE